MSLSYWVLNLVGEDGSRSAVKRGRPDEVNSAVLTVEAATLRATPTTLYACSEGSLQHTVAEDPQVLIGRMAAGAECGVVAKAAIFQVWVAECIGGSEAPLG